MGLAGLLVFLLLISVNRSAPSQAGLGSVDQVDPAQVAAMQSVWGLRVTNVAVVAGGGRVDLRFQAIDPDKALAVHDRENLPVLINEATGEKVGLNYDEHGHTNSMRPGGMYYLLFHNAFGRIKPGSRVTIQIGDVKLSNVLVQ